MQCDVAVEGPDTWIIGHVLDDDVARLVESAGTVRILCNIGAGHHLHISALRVLCIALDGAIPFTSTLGENPEVVAVQMHGVRDWSGVVNVEADGAVAAEVVDVPLFREAEVPLTD